MLVKNSLPSQKGLFRKTCYFRASLQDFAAT